MRYLALCLLLGAVTVANAQTINGNGDSAFAVGKWKESGEGVSLFCARVTTRDDVIKGNSSGACFLTEAQINGRDSVLMSTNILAVTAWDSDGVTAATDFYADKNGDQTSKSTPGAIKIRIRLVVDFKTHRVKKFVETSTGKTVGLHLGNQ